MTFSHDKLQTLKKLLCCANIFGGNASWLTLLLERPDGLELLDDGGEGVGDDGDHDEEREEEDEHGGHDQLDVGARHAALLLEAVLAHARQDRTDVLWTDYVLRKGSQ